MRPRSCSQGKGFCCSSRAVKSVPRTLPNRIIPGRTGIDYMCTQLTVCTLCAMLEMNQVKKENPQDGKSGAGGSSSRREKGVRMNTVLDGRIIGSREMRSNLSDFLDQVINKKRTIIVGRLPKLTETAALIPTEVLEYLVAGAKFSSSVAYDRQTRQYVASVEDFNADGVGETPGEAVEMALDNMESLVKEFFSNADKYLGFERFKKRLPQYLKLRMAADRRRMAEILGFRLGD